MEGPDRQEVGLELRNQVDRRLHPVPVVLRWPRNSSARVQRTLAAIPRAPPSRASLSMKLPVSTWPIAASPRSLFFLTPLSHSVYGIIAPKDGDDDQPVDDLATQVGPHAATSRFFRMKYPAMEKGKAYAKASSRFTASGDQRTSKPSATVLLTSSAESGNDINQARHHRHDDRVERLRRHHRQGRCQLRHLIIVGQQTDQRLERPTAQQALAAEVDEERERHLAGHEERDRRQEGRGQLRKVPANTPIAVRTIACSQIPNSPFM